MAPTDPKQGGDLSDMAVEGTSIPGDAGKMNTIPSKPRPDQISDANEMGAADLAGAADNASDIPRSFRDQGLGGSDIVTGTGDPLPAQTDSKRLHNVPGGVVNDPAAKGSTRYEQHKRQNGSDEQYGASEGAAVDKPAGSEGLGSDEVRDRVDGAS